MRSVNRLTLLGNVGSIKVFNGCIKVSVATNRIWSDNGQRQERTDWVPVTIFDVGIRHEPPCGIGGDVADCRYGYPY